LLRPAQVGVSSNIDRLPDVDETDEI